MTPAEAVAGCAGPVSKLGGAWMFDPTVAARGAEQGLSTWSWYYCGRGGALGDGPAEPVVAAFGFFPPVLMTKAWDRGRAVQPVGQTAGEYARACAEWGSRVFADVPEAGRLAELLDRVSAAASAAGLPLFAGWRALAASLDVASAGGRLALALQVGRELRGGSHLLAVAAEGVPPLQAVVSGRYGADSARFFGWPEPYPDPEAAREAMARAEERTNALLLPAFAVLSDAERAELVAGLRALRV